jgi:hypothetical protein
MLQVCVPNVIHIDVTAGVVPRGPHVSTHSIALESQLVTKWEQFPQLSME